MSEYLSEIVRSQKNGERRGIASICSAHPWVLKTALQGGEPVLIEATCNQVNQFGGYTGMTAAGFRAFVHELAKANDFPVDHLILGGDHLGPSPWQHLPAESAMRNAAELVRSFVQAGFTKIHLDTSMHLGGDDPAAPLNLELAARRMARLAKITEDCPEAKPNRLRYVIGTEVPIPGGAQAGEAGLQVTTVEQARSTIEAIRAAFEAAGLQSAWERVIALVVQPGVEFGSDYVVDYDPAAAADLARLAETIPLIYEAHSTDYQRPESLHSLVRDHFAILKVGPGLTFAFREAVFALAEMEAELFQPEQCSHIIEVMDEAMLKEPDKWQDYYRGNEMEVALARKFSLSDRIRYYWAKPAAQKSLARLLENFGEKPLPVSLVSQYMHQLYSPIREGKIRNSVDSILSEAIRGVLREYEHACRENKLAA